MSTPESAEWSQLCLFLRTEVLDMTRATFGELAGVSEVSVYNWESGRKGIGLEAVQALAASLAEYGVDYIGLADLLEPDVDAARKKRKVATALGVVEADAPATTRILAYLKACGAAGASDDEIADVLELKSSTASRKRRQLVADGLVREARKSGNWRVA